MGDFGREFSCKCAARLIQRIKGEDCDGTDFKMGVAAPLPELNEWTLTNTLIKRFMARGGEGDFLIKVGTDVRRVQNLGRAKFSPKNPMPRQKNAQKPNDRASFHEL